MKNAMKKLMTLALVAVMLISAIPFQASAAEPGTFNYAIKFMDGSKKCDVAGHAITGNVQINVSVTAEYLLTQHGLQNASFQNMNYGVKKNATKTETVTVDKIDDGATINIRLNDQCPKCKEAASVVEKFPVQLTVYGEGFDSVVYTYGNKSEDGIKDVNTAQLLAYVDGSKYTVIASTLAGPAKRGNAWMYSVQATKFEKDEPSTETTTEATEDSTTTPVVKNPVKVVFKNEDSSVIKTIAKWDLRYDNTAADQLLYYAKKNYGLDSAYEFGKNSDGASVWVKHEGKTRGEYIGVSDYLIVPGDEVHIVLKKDTTPESVPAETLTPAKPNFGKYDQFEVYLHVYLNGNISEPHKNINITDPFALDGNISIKEVEKVIATYYGAKTIAGIDIDGIYFSTRNWTKDFILDQNKFTKLVDLDEWVLGQRVDLNVMINNAYVKSASTNTADTSNPKTGDNIFMTVSVMGLSATALAAAFFFSKKRAVR